MAAAKQVLADITMEQLYNAPSVSYEEDEVTRVVVDGLNQNAFNRIKSWNVSRLREWLLDDRTSGEDIAGISPGLTPEMVAAVATYEANLHDDGSANNLPGGATEPQFTYLQATTTTASTTTTTAKAG